MATGTAGASVEAAEAITTLLEEHGGKLFGLSLRLCGSREDAEELVQEIFTTAFTKWGQFEGRSAPTTWLYTIASRACLRKHRRRAGEPRTMESLEALVSSPTRARALISEGETPFEQLARLEARDRVEGALRRVPKNFRIALILKDIIDLSMAEVATVLGIKEATARTRVHRARLVLREALVEPAVAGSAGRDQPSIVCRDLLIAKLDAIDRGVDLSLPTGMLAERCGALLESLDLTREACRQLGEGSIPPGLRDRVTATFG